jgi:hypothetical protein
MQSIAAGIGSLTNELLGTQPADNGENDIDSEPPASGGLAQEIRQYLRERQDEEDKIASLHESIKGLAQQIRDEATERSPEGSYVQFRWATSLKVVLVLLEQQRIYFEGIVRDFAARKHKKILYSTAG